MPNYKKNKEKSIPCHCYGKKHKYNRHYKCHCKIVKYIRGGAPDNGDGSKSAPFNLLSQAETHDWDILMVLPSDVTLVGTLHLKHGQVVKGHHNCNCEDSSEHTGLSIINGADSEACIVTCGNNKIYNMILENAKNGILATKSKHLTVKYCEIRHISGEEVESANSDQSEASAGIRFYNTKRSGVLNVYKTVIKNVAGIGIALFMHKDFSPCRKVIIDKSEITDITQPYVPEEPGSETLVLFPSTGRGIDIVHKSNDEDKKMKCAVVELEVSNTKFKTDHPGVDVYTNIDMHARKTVITNSVFEKSADNIYGADGVFLLNDSPDDKLDFEKCRNSYVKISNNNFDVYGVGIIIALRGKQTNKVYSNVSKGSAGMFLASRTGATAKTIVKNNEFSGQTFGMTVQTHWLFPPSDLAPIKNKTYIINNKIIAQDIGISVEEFDAHPDSENLVYVEKNCVEVRARSNPEYGIQAPVAGLDLRSFGPIQAPNRDKTTGQHIIDLGGGPLCSKGRNTLLINDYTGSTGATGPEFNDILLDPIYTVYTKNNWWGRENPELSVDIANQIFGPNPNSPGDVISTGDEKSSGPNACECPSDENHEQLRELKVAKCNKSHPYGLSQWLNKH